MVLSSSRIIAAGGCFGGVRRAKKDMDAMGATTELCVLVGSAVDCADRATGAEGIGCKHISQG
jgi:hypothetical protein